MLTNEELVKLNEMLNNELEDNLLVNEEFLKLSKKLLLCFPEIKRKDILRKERYYLVREFIPYTFLGVAFLIFSVVNGGNIMYFAGELSVVFALLCSFSLPLVIGQLRKWIKGKTEQREINDVDESLYQSLVEKIYVLLNSKLKPLTENLSEETGKGFVLEKKNCYGTENSLEDGDDNLLQVKSEATSVL